VRKLKTWNQQPQICIHLRCIHFPMTFDWAFDTSPYLSPLGVCAPSSLKFSEISSIYSNGRHTIFVHAKIMEAELFPYYGEDSFKHIDNANRADRCLIDRRFLNRQIEMFNCKCINRVGGPRQLRYRNRREIVSPRVNELRQWRMHKHMTKLEAIEQVEFQWSVNQD